MAEEVIFSQKKLTQSKKRSIGKKGGLSQSAWMDPSMTDNQSQEEQQKTNMQNSINKTMADTTQKTDETEADIKKFHRLTQAEHILFQATTVFPFTLFPDTVTISETKVSITHRLFFFTKEVTSIAVKDIAYVNVGTDIFFGTLDIIDKYFEKEELKVTFLWKKDALEARRILQGLIITEREGIDITNVNKVPEIKQKIESIGTAHT